MSKYQSEYDHRACEHGHDEVNIAACDMDSTIAELEEHFEAALGSYDDEGKESFERLRAAWARLCERSGVDSAQEEHP